MARLILGVTGSVAAVRTPVLHTLLCAAGHEVRIVATRQALYFFDAAALGQSGSEQGEFREEPAVFRDSDEWPKPRYERGDDVLHISFRKWADVLIVAPLDANTLAKFAVGIADNFLTCVFRAWDFSKPVVLAPAMNTLMWESPVTRRHLRQLLEDHARGEIPQDGTRSVPATSEDHARAEIPRYGTRSVPATTEDDARGEIPQDGTRSLPATSEVHAPQPIARDFSLDDAAVLFAQHAPNIVLVPPQAKRLACGDVGVGAMAEVAEIARAVAEWSAESANFSES
jgi:phosphopantothenoylcysteine decarboxylase